jgi:surfeit locus 1 family protein
MPRLLLLMVSKKWLLTTLFVVFGSALCARLGFWQLDRLSQRRSFNAHVMEMRALPPLDLNTALAGDLTAMEYRAVLASGEYDFSMQVALRNEYHDAELGYHLLTPLKLEDGAGVLVDRGWIPADGNSSSADWRKFDQDGVVTVRGLLRLGLARPAPGGVPASSLNPDQSRQELWTNVDVAGIGRQIPYPLLPVLIVPDVDPADVQPPIPSQEVIELTEGPHLGYAGQWFAFAAMLFFGYPLFYLRKQEAIQ